MSNTLTLKADIELQAAGDKPGRIEIVAYTGGIMQLPGLGQTVVDVDGIDIGVGTITLLADHDNSVASIVGRATVRKQSGQLLATGTISDATESGRMVRALGKEGQPLQASIGASVVESRRVRAGERVTLNNRVIQAPAEGMTLVTKSRLREITITPLGADADTRVAVAAKHESNNMTMTTTDPVLAERDRIKTIEATCKGDWGHNTHRVADLKAKAIDGDLSIEAMQGELLGLLRSSRPTAPSMGGQRYADAPAQADILQASLCASAGVSEKYLGEMFDERTLNAAMSAEHRGAGLQSVCRAVLAANGEHPQRIGDTQIRASLSMSQNVQASAGFSTLSVTNVLSNTANKLSLVGYNMIPTTWRLFCAIGNNSNFKQHSRMGLISDGSYEPVGAGGELKHGSIEDQNFTSQVQTRGKIIGITRQNFIDDDLNTFAEIPMMLGRDGAIALDKLAHEKLMGNANSFFDAANNNLETTNSLSAGGLTTAEQLFLDQTDPAGQPTLVKPSTIYVPTALNVLASQLVNAAQLNEQAIADSVNALQVPNNNPHAGRFTAATSPWLSSATMTGNSATSWYLFADPAQGVAPFRASFLNGQQVPTVETADASFETLGVQMRCYHDFGVDQEDPRAAVKSTA